MMQKVRLDACAANACLPEHGVAQLHQLLLLLIKRLRPTGAGMQLAYALVLNKAMAYGIIAVGALGFTAPTTIASIISNHTSASEQVRSVELLLAESSTAVPTLLAGSGTCF